MEPLLAEENRDRTRRSLWLVWGIGSCLLLLVLSLAWSRYQIQSEILLANQLRAVEPVADLLAADTERMLYGAQQLFYATQVLMQHAEMPGVTSNRIQNNLLQLIQGQGYLDALIVLNQGGDVVHWSRDEKAPILQEALRRSIKSYLLEGGEDLQVGLPQRSPIDSKEWVFSIYRAVRADDGSFRSLMLVMVNLPRFMARYEEIELPDNSVLALAAGDGTIYFRLPDSEAYFGKKRQVPDTVRQQEDFPRRFTMSDPSSENGLLVVTSQVDQYELWAAMVLSRQSVLAGWRGELIWLLMLLGLFAVVFIAGMVLVSYQLRVGARSRSVLALQASTDVLTGSYNRRYLEVIAQQQQRGRELDRLCCVCVMDIDLFKEINDQYGHVCGDEVLKRVAMALRDVCRESDILVRFGGDEFVLVLPQTALEGAHIMVEKCRVAISRLVMYSAGKRLSLSGSFGLSQWLSGEELDHALRRADAALYQAKKAGRDCVVIVDAATSNERGPYPDE